MDVLNALQLRAGKMWRLWWTWWRHATDLKTAMCAGSLLMTTTMRRPGWPGLPRGRVTTRGTNDMWIGRDEIIGVWILQYFAWIRCVWRPILQLEYFSIHLEYFGIQLEYFSIHLELLGILRYLLGILQYSLWEYFSIHFENTSVFAPTYTAVFSVHTLLDEMTGRLNNFESRHGLNNVV